MAARTPTPSGAEPGPANPYPFGDREATVSILTKVFVVLVTVLSVAMVAMVVPLTMNPQTYKQHLIDARARIHLAETKAQEAEARYARILRDLEQLRRTLAETKADLTNQIGDLQTDLIEADILRVAALNQAAAIRAEFVGLSSSLSQSTEITALQQAEIVRRRDETLRLQKENIGLNNTLRDMSTMLASLEDLTRMHKEEIRSLEDQNRTLRDRFAALAVDTDESLAQPDIEFVGPNLRGTVKQVKHVGDHTFVVINLGSNDDVREGMKFLIHDDSLNFIANAVVKEVDLNESAAMVTLMPEGRMITVNQEAWSGGR
ncbi:MAG: hypothetical protein CMJ49_11210 [Planctomycetaceae bacterium]|nr:hypothetical protein [Planctomycetaceae bacterium]